MGQYQSTFRFIIYAKGVLWAILALTCCADEAAKKRRISPTPVPPASAGEVAYEVLDSSLSLASSCKTERKGLLVKKKAFLIKAIDDLAQTAGPSLQPLPSEPSPFFKALIHSQEPEKFVAELLIVLQKITKADSGLSHELLRRFLTFQKNLGLEGGQAVWGLVKEFFLKERVRELIIRLTEFGSKQKMPSLPQWIQKSWPLTPSYEPSKYWPWLRPCLLEDWQGQACGYVLALIFPKQDNPRNIWLDFSKGDRQTANTLIGGLDSLMQSHILEELHDLVEFWNTHFLLPSAFPQMSIGPFIQTKPSMPRKVPLAYVKEAADFAKKWSFLLQSTATTSAQQVLSLSFQIFSMEPISDCEPLPWYAWTEADLRIKLLALVNFLSDPNGFKSLLEFLRLALPPSEE